jgi:hypothetical protein
MSPITNATLRLFKAVPVDSTHRYVTDGQILAVNRLTVPQGYVVAPSAVGYFSSQIGSGGASVFPVVNELYGLDAEKLNNSFHKSFAKVRDASIQQLVVEQIIHYLTTYGAERDGWYSDDTVYVPAERLDVPDIDVKGFSFVVIRGLTDAQIRSELLNLLGSGAALSEESVSDATLVGTYLGLTAAEILSVKNNEVRARLYDELGVVPSNPVEFLRFVTYRLTGTSLLIKNAASVAALSEGAKGQASALAVLFERYERDHGIAALGEIFNRFKPLFLALRSAPEMRPVINKISRASKFVHKPLAGDYLNSVTAEVKRGTFSRGLLSAALSDANTFRKVRLAQALAFRAGPDVNSIVYKVRNGKSFATDFAPWSAMESVVADFAYEQVLASIATDLSGKVAGKTVYIPAGVFYGLPATEKQFTGNLPAGTYIEAPENGGLFAGVHWVDQAGQRVDLDLSIMSATAKVGWDGLYRNDGRSVLFSGDMTSAPAPKGASEVFWFGPDNSDSWLVNLNYYNGYHGETCPYKIVVGITDDGSAVQRNNVIDPNEVLAHAAMTLDTRQAIIGLVSGKSDTGRNRFYFSASANGGGASATRGAQADRVRNFMVNSAKTAPSLNDVLRMSGAIFVDTPEGADFDLSPSVIDKATLLSLLS